MQKLLGYKDKELVDKIKNELGDYFTFVALLERGRDLEIQQLIEEYIKIEPNITKRIRHINELDKSYQPAEHISPVELLGTKEELSQTEKAKGKVKAKDSENKELGLKTTNTFIHYLFNTRKEIKPFAKWSNVISCGIFSLRLNGNASFKYKQILSISTNLLLKPANYLVEHGWKVLDRKSYNIVVTFANFLKTFSQLGNVFRHEDNRFFIKQIELYIEPYFQLIQSNQDYTKIIKIVFQTHLDEVKVFKPILRDILNCLDKILAVNSKGPSLLNIILGAFIVNFKKNIKLEHLIKHYHIKKIDVEKYAFSSRVYHHIKEQIKLLEQKYYKAEEQLYLLRFLDEAFNFKVDTKAILYPLFGKIYLSEYIRYPKTFEDLKKSFRAEDHKFLEQSPVNMTFSMDLFLTGFLRVYQKFLIGNISLLIPGEGGKIKELFSDWIFMGEVQILRQVKSEMDGLKGANALISVSYENYSHYKTTGKTQLEREKRLCLAFDQIFDAFFTIATKVAIILYNNFTAHNVKGEQKLMASAIQNNSLVDLAQEPRLLPYAIFKINGHPQLEGQTVTSVLNEIVIFCLNFCYIYNYDHLFEKLTLKKEQLEETELYLNMKSKLLVEEN